VSAAETPSAADSFPFVVFGDFICPWSFSALDVVDAVATTYGLQPQWRPHMLRPDVPPEGVPFPDERREATKAWLAETAPEAAAEMRFPDRIQFSFRAFEVLEYARDHHRDIALARSVFDALWRKGDDIANVETLQAAAVEAGLDGDDVGRALREGQYVERAFAAVHQARRLGITATPTFILGRTRINGWHYIEVLQQVVEEQGLQPVL
jgi:predicted DsbA family dithiol-disulfide isomerase